jgi:hypothetical protein
MEKFCWQPNQASPGAILFEVHRIEKYKFIKLFFSWLLRHSITKTVVSIRKRCARSIQLAIPGCSSVCNAVLSFKNVYPRGSKKLSRKSVFKFRHDLFPPSIYWDTLKKPLTRWSPHRFASPHINDAHVRQRIQNCHILI